MSGIKIDEAIENVLVNCYKLAERYHCDPDIFLRKSVSQIGRHLYWTDRMNVSDNDEERWQEKLRDS